MSNFDEARWLLEVKRNLTLDNSYETLPCISSVSTALLKECEDAYVPQIVSIGPYHFGKEKLSGMERLKDEAARRELERIQNSPGKSNFKFDQLIDKIKSREDTIKRCYNKRITFRRDVLVWMITRDACFILEFFRNYLWGLLPKPHPIFGRESEIPGIKFEIIKDLIKLENQIPLFVLEEVLAMETGDSLENAHFNLQKLLKPVFQNIYYRPFDSFNNDESPRQNHILDIYYYCCLGKEEKYEHKICVRDPQDHNEMEEHTRSTVPCAVESEEERKRSKFPSAVELKNGGVKIQATGRIVQDVSFKGGTLSIPPITLNVDSEIFIRNLIALEVSCPYGRLQRMTAFAQFINKLCQTENGAAVLRDKRVIVGTLWQHSEIARFLSSCRHSPPLPSEFPIEITRRNLINYYNRNLWKYAAGAWNAFYNFYSSNPWSVIGGMGATTILILTALQVHCAYHSCGGR